MSTERIDCPAGLTVKGRPRGARVTDITYHREPGAEGCTITIDDSEADPTFRMEVTLTREALWALLGRCEPEPVRQVEYFRCWFDGRWDTALIAVPRDVPDNRLDEAVREAAQRLPWSGDAPAFVGLYFIPVDPEDRLARTPGGSPNPSAADTPGADPGATP